MNYKDLGHPIREPGQEPFLFITGVVALNGYGTQTDQETHIRPPASEKWLKAHVLIDKQTGELVMWCKGLDLRFRRIEDHIECWNKNATRVILDSHSTHIIHCIEEQVEGNLRKYPLIVHKNKKKPK